MRRLVSGLVMAGMITSSFGLEFTTPVEQTTLLLVAHSKYMYKHKVNPNHEPTEILKAMRVCIVTQMSEVGCPLLLETTEIQGLIND